MSVGTTRYRAFISYSHRDAKIAQKLHRRLEGFSIPRALRHAASGGVRPSSRLGLIFRDRDELASASNLSHSIEEALDESAALVVVCSPAAVGSRWVDAEIAYFREHHPDRPVFAFIVDGDPAIDPRTDPLHAAFPANLVAHDARDPAAPPAEPVAADARIHGDGFAQAFLKLVAGLLAVRYDQLRQRQLRRRQRRWAALAGLTTVLAVVFAALALQATRARDAAREAQARAELELTSEQQTREFLLSVFRLADANETRGNSVTVREVLDRAVARIDRTEFVRAQIRARFLATMGQAYSSLGLTKRGVDLLSESIAAIGSDRESPGERTQRTDSRIELADLLFSMGEYDRATSALDAIGDDDGSTWQQRARIANVRGDIFAYTEKDDAARQSYASALATVDRSDVGRSRDGTLLRSRALSGVATVAQFAGDYAAAERGYEQVVTLLEPIVGDKQPETIAAIVSLGSSAYQLGDLPRARAEFLRGLQAAQALYDPGSPVIANIENNLGRLLLETGDPAGAEPLLRDALASDRKYMSETFDDLAYPLFNLAAARYAQGDRDEAKRLLDEALPISENSHHRMLGPILSMLSDLYCGGGDTREGSALATRAVTANEEHADVAPWYAAQAGLTRLYCDALAGAAVGHGTAAPLAAQLERKWGATSPFVLRARAQTRAIETAKSR